MGSPRSGGQSFHMRLETARHPRQKWSGTEIKDACLLFVVVRKTIVLVILKQNPLLIFLN